ncbi:hypothetical protein BD560DRAFT_301738, partial [Blakeslea trispora]
RFYQNLYAADTVPHGDIDSYLQGIQFDRRLTEDDKEVLEECITVENLQSLSKRSPKQSSPGSDGLGYAYMQLLFSIPELEPLIEEV